MLSSQFWSFSGSSHANDAGCLRRTQDKYSMPWILKNIPNTTFNLERSQRNFCLSGDWGDFHLTYAFLDYGSHKHNLSSPETILTSRERSLFPAEIKPPTIPIRISFWSPVNVRGNNVLIHFMHVEILIQNPLTYGL
ncbi:hypothetical protein TNCV_707811 [Trichonephila clavipes]|nr:hypothetical protein TNCV_707811 [Trichonephila clavipes]